MILILGGRTAEDLRYISNNVIFYNRVSKAGSKTLIEILRHISINNGFQLARDSILRTNFREDIMLSYEQQVSPYHYSGFHPFIILFIK